MTWTRTQRRSLSFDGLLPSHEVAMLSLCRRRVLGWLRGLSDNTRDLTIRIAMAVFVALLGIAIAFFVQVVSWTYEVLADR